MNKTSKGDFITVKKILSAVIVLLLLLSLAACGGNPDKPSETTENAETDTVAATDSVPATERDEKTTGTNSSGNEAEDLISSDIVSVLKDATSAEFIEENLKDDSDFMNVADKTGIDCSETSSSLSSMFSIKVKKISFESEQDAVVLCELTSPDFGAMYKHLGADVEQLMKDVNNSKISKKEFYEEFGRSFSDNISPEKCPLATNDMKFRYVQEDGVWVLKNKESALKKMRSSLKDFLNHETVG